MKTLTLIASIAFVGACASHRGYALPESIARNELQCPSGPIQLVDIDHRTRGAIGCGRRAAFIVTCDYAIHMASVESQCTWHRDPPPANAGTEAVAPATTGGAQ